MNRDITARTLLRIHRASAWTALALAVKCAACLLPMPSEVLVALHAPNLHLGASAYAALAGTALATCALVMHRSSWSYAFALVATLDLVTTGAILGVPDAHPIIVATLIALCYGGGSLLAVAAWSAALVLRSASPRRRAQRPASASYSLSVDSAHECAPR